MTCGAGLGSRFQDDPVNIWTRAARRHQVPSTSHKEQCGLSGLRRRAGQESCLQMGEGGDVSEA